MYKNNSHGTCPGPVGNWEQEKILPDYGLGGYASQDMVGYGTSQNAWFGDPGNDGSGVIPAGEKGPFCQCGCGTGNMQMQAYTDVCHTGKTFGKENQTCYTFSIPNTYKEEKVMSFVGISYVDGRIFAFADSKSSRTENGAMVEDYARPVVNKIFSNSKFIMVMYGRNSMEIGDNGNTAEVYLEDLIPGLAGENDSFWEAMVNFKKYVDDNLRRSSSDFSFIGAYWTIAQGQKTLNFSNCTVNKDKFVFQESSSNPKEAECRFAGDTRYVRHYERYSYRLLSSNKEYIEKELIDTINMFGRYPNEYNPVGGPVSVVEFLPHSCIQ